MTRLVAATAVIVAAGLAVRWLRSGTAMSAEAWAEDPIGPDDLAG
ncbi:hypothetical protein ACWDUM_11455 [Rhodococcus sp. NPDC003322]